MYKLSFIALVLATAFFACSDEKTTEKEVEVSTEEQPKQIAEGVEAVSYTHLTLPTKRIV